MRPRTVPAVVLALPLLLTGCGAVGSPGTTAHGGGATITISDGRGFAARARQVAAAWPGSARERAWRTGYYPLADPTVLPADAFHSGADKAAFLAGRFTFRVPLPTVPAREAVRFDAGPVLELPSLEPEKALREAGTGACPTVTCDTSLTVTAATPTTLRVATSRGRATVPAWSFRLAGYRGPLVVPAVRPSTAASGASGVRPDGVSGSVLSADLVSVSADGRTLSLSVPYGSCGEPGGYPVHGSVLETADAVVVGGWVSSKPPPAGQECAGLMTSGRTTVRLSRPLGSRVVLDVGDGAPEQPEAARS